MIDTAVTAFVALWATNTTLPSYTIDIDQVDGWLRVAGEVTVVVVAVWQIRKRADRNTAAKTAAIAEKLAKDREEMEARLIEKLEQRTLPIQPKHRNGGDSLADIAFEQQRQKQVLSDQNHVLEKVHSQVQESRTELALHRAAVQEQLATFRSERERILAAAALKSEAWAVALGQQGITVPADEETL